MKKDSPSRRLVEIFGHASADYSPAARKFWLLSACPFIRRACTKYDHTNTICYGTCSVTNAGQEVMICPNRLYADDYGSIRKVSYDVFGDIPFLLFDDYIKATLQQGSTFECIVALGQNSGKEVKLSKMSMDWVLAHIKNGILKSYVGIEVQSIDITGNYRDSWYAARDQKAEIPHSAHGLNWANVHKRLIPQIIRKGLIYSRSSLVQHGLYFIAPEPVYQRFEEIIGHDIPLVQHTGKDIITVHTYQLGDPVPSGEIRALHPYRTIRFKLEEFASRFIAGAHLPTGSELDGKIKAILACS